MSDGGELVFVYGTLRSGASNAFRMEGAKLLGLRYVRGRLYRIDWYPGLVLDPEGAWVVGELWEVSPEKLAELDEYEGGEYRRVEVEAFRARDRLDLRTLDIGSARVWVWEWKGPVDADSRIRAGDWLDVECPRNPPVCTTMGCLGLIGLPIGGLAIPFVLERYFPTAAERTATPLIALSLLAAPVSAWMLATWADRRGENGEGLRELMRVVLVLVGFFLVLAGGGLLVWWLSGLVR